MSSPQKNSTSLSSGHLPWLDRNSRTAPSTPTSEPRKLTIVEAAHYRFYERVSNGITTLMQHGYSRKRAKDILCRELAQAGNGVCDNEVFDAMKIHGLGIEETKTALMISKAFERVMAQKQLSTDGAMDYLSSRITTMKLLAHMEGRNEQPGGRGIGSEEEPLSCLENEGKACSKEETQADGSDDTTTRAESPIQNDAETENTNLDPSMTPQTSEASTNSNNHVSERSQSTLPCPPNATSIGTKPIPSSPPQQPSSSSNNNNNNIKSSTTTNPTNTKEDKSNSTPTNNRSTTKQCPIKNPTTKAKRTNSIRGKRTRLASSALEEHAQDRLSSSQPTCTKRPRLDSV